MSVSPGAFYWLRLHTWLQNGSIALSGCTVYSEWYQTDGDGNGDHNYIVKATSNSISAAVTIDDWTYRTITLN